MDWKLDLYKKIAPHVAPHAIVASATPRACRSPSCREALPEEIKPRFCGIHFFNPPRYMALVELIADADDASRRCSTSSRPSSPRALGKGVVRAKDTPNFIANRVGIAGMLATMKEAEKFGLTLRRGRRPHRQEARPRQQSGTFRTADVVGLDTMAHVIKTLQDNLQDDPFYRELRDAAGAGSS